MGQDWLAAPQQLVPTVSVAAGLLPPSQPSADFCRDLLSLSYFQGLVISLFYFTFLMSTLK